MPNAQLTGAEQRHVAEAELTSSGGRKLGSEVVGCSEDDADEIVMPDGIALEHRADKCLSLGVDLRLRVLGECRRAPQCQQSHGSPRYSDASPAPPSPAA